MSDIKVETEKRILENKLNKIAKELAGVRKDVDIEDDIGAFISEKGKFLPHIFAKWLHEESDHHFLRIRQTNEVYYYKDGIYVPFGKSYIEQIIQREVKWDAVITKNAVNEIIAYISRLCVCEIDVIQKRENVIVCNNGVVDLITKELMPHSHKNYAFKKIPWDYNPYATCDKFDALVKKLVPDEITADALYTMIGYTLVNSYIYNQIFFLYGPPGTGKTTITNIITELLSSNNVSNVRLHDLIDRPFMRVALINSYVNFCGDASNTPIRDASVLKVLSGDGRMDVDMKNIPIPLKLQNYAKLIIDTNEMPAFDNRDDALHRRIVVLKFNTIITEEEKSADFFEAHTTQDEMEGILVKAIDKAHNILTKQNPFKRMPIQEAKEEYEMITWNIVDDFINTHIQIINDHPEEDIFETQVDIWAQFKSFAQQHGNNLNGIPRARKFNDMLRSKCGLGLPKTKTHNKINRKVYYNVKLINVDIQLSGFLQ